MKRYPLTLGVAIGLVLSLFISPTASAGPPAGCEPPPSTGAVSNWANNDGSTATFNEFDANPSAFEAPPDTETITFGTTISGTFPASLAADEDSDVLRYREVLNVVPVVDVMRLDIRMDWVDFPDGLDRQLLFSAWRDVENMNVYVRDTALPPPSWQLIGVVTATSGTGTSGNFNWVLSETQWNGGDVAIRFEDVTQIEDVGASDLFLDRVLLSTDPTNYNLFVECGWVAGTQGGQLLLDAWAQHSGIPETFSLQVRTPPSTWNTRLTIPVGADGQPSQSYFLTPAEFNAGGTVVIRIIGNDETGDEDFGIVNVDQLTLVGPPPNSVPDVSTVAASGITATTATLRGNLNMPGLPPTTVYFEWGTTPSLGQSTPPAVQNEAGPFQRQITGLTAGTTYYFRACGESPFGTECDTTLQFTTTESVLEFIRNLFSAVFYALFLIAIVAAAVIFRRRFRRDD